MNGMIKLLKRLFLAGLLLLVVLIGGTCIDHLFSTTLPPPTGAFPVGRTTLHVVDSLGGGSKREVFAWVWYPAAKRPDSTVAYLPQEWLNAIAHAGSMPAVVSRDLSKVKTHSAAGLEVAAGRPNYPLVLFRGGLSTLAPEYTALAEEWASRGYIVVGLDAPTLSRVFVETDGRVIERSVGNNPENFGAAEAFDVVTPRMVAEWALNASAILDQLKRLAGQAAPGQWAGRIDFDRVAMAGHSLGGTVALQFALQDPRCKAAIDIDGLVTAKVADKGPRVPVLFLMGDHPKSESADSLGALISRNLEKAYQGAPQSLISKIDLPHANHYNFSDGAVTKNHFLMGLLRMAGIVRMAPLEQLDSTRAITVRFLDDKLTGH
jgi:dienelactone hydrolase